MSTPRLLSGPITRALVVENPHPSLDALLKAQGVEVVRVPGAAPDEEGLIAALLAHRSQALFKRSRVPVTRRVLDACPDLHVVQLCCIGDDSVDKQAAAAHGVMVFNDPVSNNRSVVELAVGHLIALSRRLFETDQDCRAGGWDKSDKERFELLGKTIGVLGLGNIGRGTARACEALGMTVRFFDTREVSRELGAELGWSSCDSVEALFRSSDYVTAHLSATDVLGRSNAGLLTRAVLEQLGADRGPASPRIFLNLSRGFLHSAEDLLAAVHSGAIRRAAVDVYPDEPRGGDDPWVNPYRDEPRIALTPHIGASTLEAQPRIARRVAQTFLEFNRKGTIRDCVYTPRAVLDLGREARDGEVLLFIAHADTRGTKRAIDEVIHEAGASNLASAHKDLDELGLAIDLAVLDRPLDEATLARIGARAAALTGRADAVRAVRQTPRQPPTA